MDFLRRYPSTHGGAKAPGNAWARAHPHLTCARGCLSCTSGVDFPPWMCWCGRPRTPSAPAYQAVRSGKYEVSADTAWTVQAIHAARSPQATTARRGRAVIPALVDDEPDQRHAHFKVEEAGAGGGHGGGGGLHGVVPTGGPHGGGLGVLVLGQSPSQGIGTPGPTGRSRGGGGGGEWGRGAAGPATPSHIALEPGSSPPPEWALGQPGMTPAAAAAAAALPVFRPSDVPLSPLLLARLRREERGTAAGGVPKVTLGDVRAQPMDTSVTSPLPRRPRSDRPGVEAAGLATRLRMTGQITGSPMMPM